MKGKSEMWTKLVRWWKKCREPYQIIGRWPVALRVLNARGHTLLIDGEVRLEVRALNSDYRCAAYSCATGKEFGRVPIQQLVVEHPEVEALCRTYNIPLATYGVVKEADYKQLVNHS